MYSIIRYVSQKTIFFSSIILFIFICNEAKSQILVDSLNFSLESGVSASSTAKNPFWFVSDRYGLFTTDKYNTWLRVRSTGSNNITKNIDLFYGIDGVERYSIHNNLFLQQAFIGIKFGFLTIKGGKWEETFGNNDPDLSSGGIIWSGNARPVPEISISVPDYIPVPFTKRFVEFKWGISHGWFGNNSYVADAWLHHKYLYFRFGGVRAIHFEYGLHHFAQWGGVSSEPEVGKLSDDFLTFMRVFFVKEDNAAASYNEANNAVGNHLGSHNVTIDFKTDKYGFNFYWQSIFEDKSGMVLKNFPDGLWGLAISSKSYKYISKIVVELVNTTDQSGTTFDRYADSVMVKGKGNDNYFNNSVYQQGWTYKSMTIGTPLLTSPLFFAQETGPIINNKVTAFHFGIEGTIKNISYKTLYTFSNNYGTNDNPFPKKITQHSFLLNINVNDLLPWGLELSTSVGADVGKLYGNNFGVMVSVKKGGRIR